MNYSESALCNDHRMHRETQMVKDFDIRIYRQMQCIHSPLYDKSATISRAAFASVVLPKMCMLVV